LSSRWIKKKGLNQRQWNKRASRNVGGEERYEWSSATLGGAENKKNILTNGNEAADMLVWGSGPPPEKRKANGGKEQRHHPELRGWGKRGRAIGKNKGRKRSGKNGVKPLETYGQKEKKRRAHWGSRAQKKELKGGGRHLVDGGRW